MSYPVRPITIEEKEALYDKYAPCPFHTAKADISGCCIKLYTLSDSTKDMWEDNFYSMSEAVRSHGRVICLDDPNRPLEALTSRPPRPRSCSTSTITGGSRAWPWPSRGTSWRTSTRYIRCTARPWTWTARA